MKLLRTQKGMGLFEVLVALLLLVIVVLGYVVLQLTTVNSSLKMDRRVLAETIAYDLIERMRANPSGVISGAYITINRVKVAPTINNTRYFSHAIPSQNVAYQYESEGGINSNYLSNTSSSIAEQDLQDIAKIAERQNMALLVDKCPLLSLKHQCIYIAWNKTAITFNSKSDCYDNKLNKYVTDAQCLLVEAF